MNETPKSPNTTANQVRTFSDGLKAAAVALGNEMGKDAVSRGVHKSSILPRPVKDGYGTFSRKWTYIEGCRPLAELGGEASEIRCDIVSPNGRKRIVTIGQTPPEWNPDKGGQTLPDAGDSGMYVLAVAYVDDIEKNNHNATNYRYLDASDLENVSLKNNGNFCLGENTARARQITIEGLIEGTSAFLV